MNLNKLDIQAFWKGKYGNAYPIYLPVKCSVNIKLLFGRHDYYSGYKNIQELSEYYIFYLGYIYTHVRHSEK